MSLKRPVTRAVCVLALSLLAFGCASKSDDGRAPAGDRGLDGSLSLAHVRPLFDPSGSPTLGPFPTDLLTVADTSQNTGRRIRLPLPDPVTHPNDFADVTELNTLDGFGVQPRLSIPFDGGIDPSTVSSDTVFVVDLGGTLPGDAPATGAPIGINQMVWDPATNTLHVEVDEQLEQHRRYGLIVTEGVLAADDGSHLKTNAAFRDFLDDGEPAWYRDQLNAAVAAARDLGVSMSAIAVASVFTTQSITAVLEHLRDDVENAPAPAPANFMIALDGTRAAYDPSTVTSVQLRPQKSTSQTISTVPVDPAWSQEWWAQMTTVEPGAVGTIAFGSFVSPNYMVVPGEFIPTVSTLSGTPPVQGYTTIYFDLNLPAGPRPANGWPIAILGHGGAGARANTASAFAGIMASHGIATIAINAFGYGFGPNGRVDVFLTDGTVKQVRAGGRSFDVNGNTVITAIEGSTARGLKLWTVGERDVFRQTAVDLLQLVRVIEVGMDVDGDNVPDIDPSRIYYLGNSAGSMYGSEFLAVEPNVKAAVLDVPGGLSPEHGRWAPVRRGGLGNQLFNRTPRLIGPGSANSLAVPITSIEGVPVAGPVFYNENKPLRDQPIVINDVPGAIEIQEAMERHEWGQQAGQSPIPWARYLRTAPLAGVGPKSLLLQANKTDQNAVNPGTSSLLRAGNLRDRTMWYRHDLAFAQAPQDPTFPFPKNPHPVPVSPVDPNLTFREVSREFQRQAAAFLASDGTLITQPQPAEWFEVPIQGALPETMNYIP